jgi:hypothetical protein
VPGAFTHQRLAADEAVPAREPGIVDVAILDMNHGWPNVGHDAVVKALRHAAADLPAGSSLRAISFDVRRTLRLPQPDDDRYALYIGTGGPGHPDPRRNDGVAFLSQGVAETPAWESPLFRLFDAIAERDDAALLAVCHTFGLMCRWLKVAEPVARGPEKGGKSEGVLDNLLTDTARAHPWFSGLADQLPPDGRLRVLDSRLFDLIPNDGAARTVGIIAVEALGVDGPPGNAMTMMEVARDPSGRMPRILGVNHHPEIGDRANLLGMLEDKLRRGDIPREWYDQRMRTLSAHFPDGSRDRDLRTTSEFTFMGPLRFHIARAAER